MEGRWGLPIADHIMLMRVKREAANRETAKLNDLHEAEIALARANLVNCDIATEAAKKALLVEISKFSFDSSDAESDALRDTLRAGIFANTFVACPCWSLRPLAASWRPPASPPFAALRASSSRWWVSTAEVAVSTFGAPEVAKAMHPHTAFVAFLRFGEAIVPPFSFLASVTKA
jgi:hypothetical protein